MAQAVWNGSLSFGLVNIPVKLYNATAPRDVRFRQLEAGTGRRIRYRRTVGGEEPVGAREAAMEAPAPAGTEPEPGGEAPAAPPSGERTGSGADGREAPGAPAAGTQPETGTEVRGDVAYRDVVKGFELDKDRYVVVDPAELEALAPEQSRSIEIEDFVDLHDIDPTWFEKSYYVAPQWGMGAEKPYWLLLRAMEQAQKVGIARFVLRTKEYLAAIRPTTGVIVLETLFYADEVRSLDEMRVPTEVIPSQRELELAAQFIQALSTEWDPSRYRDTYRERVLELVQAKAAGQQIVEEPEPRPTLGVPDLMAALKASVEAARRDRAADVDRVTGGTLRRA
jgi:DNA end-binding protein Ku